jgi:hypothetical protein
MGYSKAFSSYLISHLEDKIITNAEDIKIILFVNLEKLFSISDSLNIILISQGIISSKKETKKSVIVERYSTILAEFLTLNEPSIRRIIADTIKNSSGAITNESLRREPIT